MKRSCLFNVWQRKTLGFETLESRKLLATLGLGDLAFTGYQSATPDKISFVLLKSVNSGTVLSISDNAWSGTALATNEGSSVLTFNGDFAAGTQLNFDANRTSGSRWAVGTATNNLSDVTGGSFALAGNGDNLFAYNGSTAPTDGNSVLWVAAFATNPFLTSGSTTTNLTYLPSVFANTNAHLSLGIANGTANENGVYSGGNASGTPDQIRTIVNSPANWTTFTTAGEQAVPPNAIITVQSNSAPTGLTLSNSSIVENAGSNAVVGTFSTIDPNAGDTFTYSLVSGTGSTDNASFNISGGTLRATNSLSIGNRSIRVRTTDQGGLFFEAVFTIQVLSATPNANLRIVSYNIAAADAPGTPRTGLNTILQAIGTEIVNGITRPIDLLALQEVFSQSSTTQLVVNMLNTIYGAGTYARGSLDGDSVGSGTQGVVYNTQTLQLLGETAIGTASAGTQPRQTIRHRFQPVGGSASTEFYVYNSHWKANNDAPSEAQRLAEAQAIRSNADALGNGKNILYVGDFNVYTGTDNGFEFLIGAGNGQALDPVNRIGAWSNNSSFVDLFTQAPSASPPSGLVGGGLDDRFDFQMLTGELFDGSGLEYRANSYRTFGNNGSVPLNGSINSTSSTALAGLSNRTQVLNLLTTVSDHLPVVVDYSLPINNAEVNLQGNSVSIVDGDTTPELADHTMFSSVPVGGSSTRTFTIQNTGAVNLTLGAFSSTNAAFSIPSPPSGPVAPGGSVTFDVVFAASTASTQLATISFVNSDADESPYDFVVSATGVAVEPLFISEILFNPPGTDAPNEYVEIRGTANSTIPSGTYLLGIEGDSSGPGDVQTVFDLSGRTIGSNGFLVIRQSGSSYSVDASATTVTATGTGFQSGAGFSADSGGTDIENSSVTFLLVRSLIAPLLTDDIDSDNNGVADGSVFSNWTVADSVAIVDNASDAAYANLVFSTTSTFVGSTGKDVVVTNAVSNAVARVGSSTGSTAADWVGGDVVGVAPNFALAPTATFPVSLRGARLNHIGSANTFVAAGLSVIQSAGNTVVTEGGATDSYTVALSSQPLADVSVTLTPDSQLSLGAGAATPVTLLFTTANWNVSQTVTVTGVSDGLVEGQHSGVISHTIASGSAADYLSLNVSSTNVLVTINDPAAVAPTLTSVVVNGADTFLNQAQRSMVTSLVVTFSAPVVLSPGAFSITNIGLFTVSSINLAQSQILVTPNASNDVYTLRFAAGTSVNTRLGTGVLGNSLADGNYRLNIDSSKVSNAGGHLSGNSVFGATAVDNFFRMYGDANGDGTVNAIDRSALQAALSASNAALDFDGNGSTSAGVDTTNYFSNNYKRRRLF